MQRQKGFTLVELMVVIAIVAIIFSVALPSYRSYILKSNRAVAKAKLLQIAAMQEQFYGDNKLYSTTLANLGFSGATVDYDNEANQTATASDAVYRIRVSDVPAPTDTTFTLSAVPQNGQEKDTDCGTLTLTETGVKGASANNCW